MSIEQGHDNYDAAIESDLSNVDWGDVATEFTGDLDGLLEDNDLRLDGIEEQGKNGEGQPLVNVSLSDISAEGVDSGIVVKMAGGKITKITKGNEIFTNPSKDSVLGVLGGGGIRVIDSNLTDEQGKEGFQPYVGALKKKIEGY